MDEELEDFSCYDCQTCGASLLPTGHCRFCEAAENDDCLDCGMCDSCIERSSAFAEQMEAEPQAGEKESGK